MTTILERFEQLHPTSARLHQRARGLFPDGVTHDIRYLTPFSLYVERAQGAHKWDVDGNEIVDLVMGHGALLLGHRRPEIEEAVATQLTQGTHYGASHKLELAWAERVQQLIPSAERVRFTSSGTEATMLAIRLARASTGRDTLVRFDSHFHGWNDNVVGAPDREGASPHALGVPDETLGNVVTIPQNDPELLRKTLHEEEAAAVILEPTGAAWGTIPFDPAFLEDARAATSETDTVLIFDEVITGFRVAPGGVQQATGITPDLTTLAKILAGGLPGGAVAGRQEILSLIDFGEGRLMDFTRRIPHPGTFNANPLSSAAGATALGIVATGKPQQQADALNRSLVRQLNAALRAAGVPGCAYGHASMFHLVLGAECPPPIDDFAWNWEGQSGHRIPGTRGKVGQTLRRGMLNEGVDLMHGGGMVSAAHTEDDVERTCESFSRTIAQMKEESLL